MSVVSVHGHKLGFVRVDVCVRGAGGGGGGGEE